jgi:hypothetical protein
MLVSALCAVHCVVLPAFLTSLPVWGVHFAENHWFEIGFLLLSFIIGIWALRQGFYHHGRFLPILLFSIGLGIMFLAGWVAEEKKEPLFRMIGATLLILSHVFNWHHSRKCNSCRAKKTAQQ